jgi:hypothetical protein
MGGVPPAPPLIAFLLILALFPLNCTSLANPGGMMLKILQNLLNIRLHPTFLLLSVTPNSFQHAPAHFPKGIRTLAVLRLLCNQLTISVPTIMVSATFTIITIRVFMANTLPAQF